MGRAAGLKADTLYGNCHLGVSGFNSAARVLLERGERATYTHNYSLRNSCLIWSGM